MIRAVVGLAVVLMTAAAGAAGADDEVRGQIDELLRLTSYARRLDQIPEMGVQSLRDRAGQEGLPRLEALERSLSEAFAPARLRAQIRERLIGAHDAKHVRTILAWYRTPLGGALTQSGLEAEAVGPEAFRTWMRAEGSKARPRRRMMLLQRIDHATGESRLYAELLGIAMDAERKPLAQALGCEPVAPPDERETRALLHGALIDGLLVEAFFAVRSLSDAQLEEYAAFVEGPAYQWLVGAIASAFADVFEAAYGEYARDVVAWVERIGIRRRLAEERAAGAAESVNHTHDCLHLALERGERCGDWSCRLSIESFLDGCLEGVTAAAACGAEEQRRLPGAGPLLAAAEDCEQLGHRDRLCVELHLRMSDHLPPACDPPPPLESARLRDRDRAARLAAVQEMAQRPLGRGEEIAPLLELLRSETDAEVRAAVISVVEDRLGTLLRVANDPEYRRGMTWGTFTTVPIPDTQPWIPLLVDLLEHDAEEVRLLAVQMLDEFGPQARSATPALRARLEDPSREVRMAVAGVLVKSGPPHSDAALRVLASEAGAKPRERIASVLRAGPAGVPLLMELAPRHPSDARLAWGYRKKEENRAAVQERLIEILLSGDDDEWRAATETLRVVGALDGKLLGRVLESPEPEVREWAALELESRTPRATFARPALARALRAPEPAVRDAALRGLAKIGGSDESIGALREVLRSPDVERRRSAVAALARADADSDVVSALIEATHDADLEVRQAAARALGRRREGAVPAAPALVDLLDDREPAVRLAAAGALGVIGPPARDAVPALIEGLEREDRAGRMAIIQALARIGGDDPRVLDLLVHRLNHEEDRNHAFEALVKIGAPATPWLLEAVESCAGPCVDLSVRALGRIRPKPLAAVPRLLRARAAARPRGEPPSDHALRQTIHGLGPEALPAVRESLHSPSPEVRALAERLVKSLEYKERMRATGRR